MKLHELKIEHKYLVEVAAGRKTFELRKNDRDYQRGDLVEFSVILKDGQILKSKVLYVITYVLKDVPEYGLADGFCIFSIKEVAPVSFPGARKVKIKTAQEAEDEARNEIQRF